MSRPDTQPAEACCIGKDKLTADRAREVASRMSSKGKRVAPYRCPHCGDYHVGRPLAVSMNTRRALQRRKGRGA